MKTLPLPDSNPSPMSCPVAVTGGVGVRCAGADIILIHLMGSAGGALLASPRISDYCLSFYRTKAKNSRRQIKG